MRATQEQMETVWNVYEMYRKRKNTQQDIADQLGLSVGTVGKITRALDFHYGIDYDPNYKVILIADKFGECF